MTCGTATATAGTNVALVKYWGKRDSSLNLPATGSLSLTLRELGTRTTVRFGSVPIDTVTLNGAPADERTLARVRALLDLVRARAGLHDPAEVTTSNSVPTAGGLASSASGFAALALAASRAAGLELGDTELSALARRGSGSAARSVFGGFVEMHPGTRDDGADAVAEPLPAADGWNVRLVVAETAAGPKAIGSTQAMERTAATSPFYAGWLAAVEHDLADARAAVAARDLARLGAVAERSCLRMHATTLGADPPILFWNAATVTAMQVVTDLRAVGISAWFTIDAGPHVKVLCAADDATVVDGALRAAPGVRRTLVASPGPGVRLSQESAT